MHLNELLPWHLVTDSVLVTLSSSLWVSNKRERDSRSVSRFHYPSLEFRYRFHFSVHERDRQRTIYHSTTTEWIYRRVTDSNQKHALHACSLLANSSSCIQERRLSVREGHSPGEACQRIERDSLRRNKTLVYFFLSVSVERILNVLLFSRMSKFVSLESQTEDPFDTFDIEIPCLVRVRCVGVSVDVRDDFCVVFYSSCVLSLHHSCVVTCTFLLPSLQENEGEKERLEWMTNGTRVNDQLNLRVGERINVYM